MKLGNRKTIIKSQFQRNFYSSNIEYRMKSKRLVESLPVMIIKKVNMD